MNPEKLYEIKKKYGSVFTVTIKNIDIVFRELTFSEYDKISEYQNSEEHSSADTEDLIINSAVVHPDDFCVDNLPPRTYNFISSKNN
jgi:hypothetical protein